MVNQKLFPILDTILYLLDHGFKVVVTVEPNTPFQKQFEINSDDDFVKLYEYVKKYRDVPQIVINVVNINE